MALPPFTYLACREHSQGILGNGEPDPARTVVDETALMAVRLLVGGTDSGQLLRLGSLLQAAAHSRVRSQTAKILHIHHIVIPVSASHVDPTITTQR